MRSLCPAPGRDGRGGIPWSEMEQVPADGHQSGIDDKVAGPRADQGSLALVEVAPEVAADGDGKREEEGEGKRKELGGDDEVVGGEREGGE